MSDPVSRILSSLRKTKEIPPKFFYHGRGARNWDRYSRDENYTLGRGEERLLARALPEIFAALGPAAVNLVDLGPGNGAKAALILRGASAHGRPVMVAALDISLEILDLVRRNGRRLFRGAPTRFFLIDFEERSIRPILRALRARFHRTSLILLLGSGNVTNNPRVLDHVRQAMIASDYFLISAELRRPGEAAAVLDHYTKKESQDVVFYGLESLGVRKSDGHFDIRFNEKKEQAEVSFVFDRSVTVGSSEPVRLEKGSRVLLFTSHKPTAASLRRHLGGMGFEIVRFLTDENERLALAMCRKKRTVG